MRSITIFLITLFWMVTAANAVLVNGYCYLAGEQDHDDTTILFEAASPTAETDSVHSDMSGFYEIELAIGIYDVLYLHSGYFEEHLFDQVFLDHFTLSDVTLQFNPAYELSGPIFGNLPKAIYHVVDDLSVYEGRWLRIEAGTEFRFCGPYSFTIGEDQRLECEGTEYDSIRFLPYYGGGITEWGGIIFTHSGDDDELRTYP
ncbi:hypothetical protein KQI52_07230 [bacterium]|nr:hypothetical protein [bacterium]